MSLGDVAVSGLEILVFGLGIMTGAGRSFHDVPRIQYVTVALILAGSLILIVGLVESK